MNTFEILLAVLAALVVIVFVAVIAMGRS